jgi:hypothetical protein
MIASKFSFIPPSAPPYTTLMSKPSFVFARALSANRSSDFTITLIALIEARVACISWPASTTLAALGGAAQTPGQRGHPLFSTSSLASPSD